MYLYQGHSIAVLSMSSVHTVFVLVFGMYLYIPSSASEPRFTGFQGVLCDANMQVPDAQQPPADQNNDRGDNRDPCPEDEEYFNRPDAATME